MKTYAINLVTDTKYTDIYDKVALNKYPIIVRCKTESELKDILSSNQTTEYVKSLIKSKRTYDASIWMIRSIYSNGDVRELSWKVSELNCIVFSE
jgi:hypothetical protein